MRHRKCSGGSSSSSTAALKSRRWAKTVKQAKAQPPSPYSTSIHASIRSVADNSIRDRRIHPKVEPDEQTDRRMNRSTVRYPSRPACRPACLPCQQYCNGTAHMAWHGKSAKRGTAQNRKNGEEGGKKKRMTMQAPTSRQRWW